MICLNSDAQMTGVDWLESKSLQSQKNEKEWKVQAVAVKVTVITVNSFDKYWKDKR